MLRDVFYYGNKPNVHPREKPAKDLNDARQQATTEHFWIINEFCDYTNFDWDFDFEFLPDDNVWAEEHINVWPSIYQKDSGTWLVANNDSNVIVYRNDVVKLKRKNIKTKEYVLLDKVDELKFDFGWHPDPTEPPYIYRWGNKYYPVELGHVIEYVVPGAEEVKYMSTVVELLPDWDNWEIPDYIDRNSFDFSWRPDPREPELIYDFGTQWQRNGGPRYICPGATEIKYVEGLHATAVPRLDDPNWKIVDGIILEHFDYTWLPDNTAPPYIYVFGNQYYDAVTMPTMEYHVPGATERKYVKDCWGTLGPNRTNWIIPENVDVTDFDFRWVPNPNDPPYIYEFGTQHQKTGGPRYIIEGATEIKYVDTQIAKALPDKSKFVIPQNIDENSFDFSWHPDNTAPPYIYHFGTQWAKSGGPVYIVKGATDIQFVDQKAVVLPDRSRWKISDDLDVTNFDFSWHPDITEIPYIYKFGTQWQKTGGPTYYAEGADENSSVKYIDVQTAIKLPNKENFSVINNYKIESFDYSWHPDETDAPYIYRFGNQFYNAENMPTLEYKVEDATNYKYINDIVATLAQDKESWIIPDGIDDSTFDYSWKPNPNDPPFNYITGTQHQKTGGPKYMMEGATNEKYIDKHVIKLPKMENWAIPENITDFDFSWHPDETDPPYIYIFGTQHQKTGGPKYVVPGAEFNKYIDTIKATALPNKDRWIIPDNIDDTNFDYSWHPDDTEQPYIYISGTQHQKNGGPRYIVEGATNEKYIDQRVIKLPKMENWVIPENITDFDFSWHPDDTDPPYIYQFGTQHQKTGGPKYIAPDAEFVKYVDTIKATALPCKDKWTIPDSIDDTGFDYSWHPDDTEQPYIYISGTQHQKTGGPKYFVEGAQENKYLNFKVIKLADKSKFELLTEAPVDSFDYSWHPDETDPPYVYLFGNNFYEAEIMPTVQYVVPGAMHVKYISEYKATLGQNKSRWIVPNNIDDSSFDYSWVPNPKDPPYIYVAGTQHQKTSGPRYVVEGAEEIKYIDKYVTMLPSMDNWTVPNDISDFDYSWHPDDTDPPYIYQFGTQWQKTGGPKYTVPGSVFIKYIENIKANKLPNKDRWTIPDNIDDTNFDYSWHPDDTEQPYIYISGTQWQKTGGPKYIVEGADQIKYIDQQVIKLADKSKFNVINDLSISDFDYSWHPDETDPPYIYHFGNNLYEGEILPTVEYKVEGAMYVKYIHEVKATLAPMKHKWIIPQNIDDAGFDYSWVPNPTSPPYIYVAGTQHQKTGGPKYVVEGATHIQYIDQKVMMLPDKSKFEVVNDYFITDFDYSWHPDETDPPYIYMFGNQHYDAEVMPTVKYVVEGAIYEKYIHEIKATLGQDKRNWTVPKNLDVSQFDFSWKPNPGEPPYLYCFGTQWQKTGGPIYTVKGATDIKYIEGSKAIMLPNPSDTRWFIPEHIDPANFDFSWHPDATEMPYIYEFGTQWQNNGGIQFRVSGGQDKKYVGGENKAKALPKGDNWFIPDGLDIDTFDFSWHPDNTAPPYIYQFGTQHQKTGGPKYIVPGCIENVSPVVYVKDIKAIKIPSKKNWIIPENTTDFDYSWHPDETDPPYIYQFGTQWQKTGGPRYEVANATDIKYITHIKALRLPSMANWSVPDNIKEFDYSWHPDDTEPPYIYEFATVWNDRGGPIYTVPGAEFKKYINDVKAKTKVNLTNWIIPDDVDKNTFDFSWVPHPQAPPYIYQFGTQWQKTGGPQYVVSGATDIKWESSQTIIRLPTPNKKNWEIPNNITDFDFSWHPDDTDPPAIYQFGTQHQKTGGPKYILPDAMEVKYLNNPKARKLPSYDNWNVVENIKFDYSWHPDDTEPPYIYKFCMEGDDENNPTGPVYTVPDSNFTKVITTIKGSIKLEEEPVATEIVPEVIAEETLSAEEAEPFVEFPKYTITVTLDDLVYEHPGETFWAVRDNIDYSKFDFNWRPGVKEAKYRYVHVFGSPDYPVTQTYLVSAPMFRQGYTDFNYVEDVKNVDGEYLASLYKPLDMFFVDRGNAETKERFEKLKQKFPNIQKTRFLNSWVDTISRCINRSNTELCWILNSELDYTNFNFNYYPNQWQTRMVHIFGTQWSHWGTTYLVNKETFSIDTKYVKIIEHLNNLNFVKERRANATNNLYDIILIDHNNKDIDKVKDLLTIKSCGKTINVVKYNKNYLETIKDVIKSLPNKKDHYVWVCSSICDYSAFDFSYICDPFAKDNLHVFYSGTQKFGDTFLLDVNTTRDIIDSLEDLKKYPKVSYTNSVKTQRLPAPVIKIESDTHAGSTNVDFTFPYMVFATEDVTNTNDDTISLWDDESKNILITSTGASRIIVPKEVKDIVKNELYDYPYIKTASRLSKSKPLDIVFLSNGELCADENYEHLLAVTKHTGNRVVRVDGVDGRVQGYHAALEASNTPWAFTVFAKLKVNNKFDWGWQPDRLQIPKHYIFTAKNPVNGLIYGHQAMIAYNKKLTLANNGKGLDFTLDDPHESVELLSGIATFNTDPYSTWRTAFREVIKLKSDYSDIAADRLSTWLTVAEGKFAENCLQGALDAVEYYDNVMGDIEELKKSYEWSWLKEYYRKKYK